MVKSSRIAGDRTYDTWETTILNDEDFGIRNSVEEWMNLISNSKTNTEDSTFSDSEGENVDYKKKLTVKQFSKEGTELRLIYNFSMHSQLHYHRLGWIGQVVSWKNLLVLGHMIMINRQQHKW